MKNIFHLLSMREIDPQTYQPLLREEMYTESFEKCEEYDKNEILKYLISKNN